MAPIIELTQLQRSIEALRRDVRRLECWLKAKATLTAVERPGAWLTVTEAAAYGHINRQVLERLARRKRIQSGRHGRDYRFRPEWIDNYLMRRGFDGRT